MNIPIIKFREMTLKENIDLIKWAYFENNGPLNVYSYTIQYFPELANIDSKVSKNQVHEIVEKVVTLNYKKNKDKIKQETERYNKIWINYNDKYFKKLSEFFKIE